LELMMIVRRSLGDLCLAIMVALPLVAYANPRNVIPQTSASMTTVNPAMERAPGKGRISLLG
jgi:hypothetical protein